jgi:hypothetical protein
MIFEEKTLMRLIYRYRGASMPVRGMRAQSFVEFALVLPLLLIILLGVVEITLFIGSYINILDLTRSAARFASNRDPFSTPGTKKCAAVGPGKVFDYFYDTSCIFSPLKPNNPASCVDPNFCDGFNSTLQFKSNEDDILIYTFTESEASPHPLITDNAKCKSTDIPPCPPWVWSDNDTDVAHNQNWLRDCDKYSSAAAYAPNFTPAIMQSYLSSNVKTMNKGFVVVEAIFCYHQVLNIPILSNFLPNPIKIDTYSIMPLPAAQPTLAP